jgi:tRNA A-37 threonylcarbamoyl transferase component Bud32
MVFAGDAHTRIEVLVPTSIAPESSDEREAFGQVWARLPAFVDGDSACLDLPELDGGIFLKGRRLRSDGRFKSLRRAGRLVREVSWLQRLRAAGVAAPEVLAYGVERRRLVPLRSFVVLRLVSGARDLRAYLRETGPDTPGRLALWDVIGRFVADLHATRLFHRDLTARNLLLEGQGANVRVWLIDCPRAEHGWLGPRRAFLRRADLFRLGRSVLFEGATTDELRALLSAAGERSPEKLLRYLERSMRTKEHGRSLRTRLWLAFGF